MAEEINIIHERIDDIPLLIGLAQKLRLAEVMDKHLGNHGHHKGLSNGTLAMGWLAYILSEENHKKYQVQEWANAHRHMLERLLGQPIREVEFNDDRLEIVLRRLSKPESWEELQDELWSSRVSVYYIKTQSIRLDTTTTYGYHEVTEDGVMQNGHSKDHRPDLAQIKLMAACAEPSGQLMRSETVCGRKADEPLYTPMINRLRNMLGKSGLLYVGDSKMSAIATRADIVAHRDYYLTPLPMVGETAHQIENWIAALVDGPQIAQLVWDEKELLAAGYEFSRQLSYYMVEQEIHWTERVQVVRSFAFAKPQIEHLEKRLDKAQQQLRSLTPPVGRGKRQYREEAKLQEAINAVLEKYKVVGLLSVSWQRQETQNTRYAGRGRGGANRPTHTQVKIRYQITEIRRNEEAIAHRKHFLGWRVMVTNLPMDQMSLPQTTLHYRRGVCIEHDFHYLKDKPIGISPLYVRRDDQIIGLTNLLALALFFLTLIQTQVRQQLLDRHEKISGLYSGQPKRTTQTPTAVAMLKAIADQQVTLSHIQIDAQSFWHITPLSDLLQRVMDYLGLSPALYLGLTQNSS